jgi:hypothetical protein
MIVIAKKEDQECTGKLQFTPELAVPLVFKGARGRRSDATVAETNRVGVLMAWYTKL